jgi:cysteinyl-tRNA synthetase
VAARAAAAVAAAAIWQSSAASAVRTSQAAAAGDFEAADAIRDRLDRIGIELRDTSSGTIWRARPLAIGNNHPNSP